MPKRNNRRNHHNNNHDEVNFRYVDRYHHPQQSQQQHHRPSQHNNSHHNPHRIGKQKHRQGRERGTGNRHDSMQKNKPNNHARFAIPTDIDGDNEMSSSWDEYTDSDVGFRIKGSAANPHAYRGLQGPNSFEASSANPNSLGGLLPNPYGTSTVDTHSRGGLLPNSYGASFINSNNHGGFQGPEPSEALRLSDQVQLMNAKLESMGDYAKDVGDYVKNLGTAVQSLSEWRNQMQQGAQAQVYLLSVEMEWQPEEEVKIHYEQAFPGSTPPVTSGWKYPNPNVPPAPSNFQHPPPQPVNPHLPSAFHVQPPKCNDLAPVQCQWIS